MHFGGDRTFLNLACLLHEALWKTVLIDLVLQRINRTFEGEQTGRPFFFTKQNEQRSERIN